MRIFEANTVSYITGLQHYEVITLFLVYYNLNSDQRLPALIGPSLLACDLSRLAEEAQRVLNAGADYLHLDVMDGHFVPNMTFGAPVIKCLRKQIVNAVFDTHLMVTHPDKWIADMAAAGVSTFTFHVETISNGVNIVDTIAQVKASGMAVGLAIKPSTPVEAVVPFVQSLDQVLVMTVEPGFGGQSFMESTLSKVRYLRDTYPHLTIQVDGGLSPATVAKAAEAGANSIVAGSAVFKGDPAEAIAALRRYISCDYFPL